MESGGEGGVKKVESFPQKKSRVFAWHRREVVLRIILTIKSSILICRYIEATNAYVFDEYFLFYSPHKYNEYKCIQASKKKCIQKYTNHLISCMLLNTK